MNSVYCKVTGMFRSIILLHTAKQCFPNQTLCNPLVLKYLKIAYLFIVVSAFSHMFKG